MTTHRFFVPPSAVRGDSFPIPTPIEHQVRRVLRLGDGAHIVLLPGDGTELHCRLDGARCVVEHRRQAAEPVHRLTVAVALLKGDALETVVQQGTELGVAAFSLVVTERAVVRELSSRRVDRLRAIARESAEQSERGVVPEIVGPLPLDDVLGPDAVVLAARDGARPLLELPPPPIVIVGPEGGFSEGEMARAAASGARSATLGPRILRARTAPAVATTLVMARSGELR